MKDTISIILYQSFYTNNIAIIQCVYIIVISYNLCTHFFSLIYHQYNIVIYNPCYNFSIFNILYTILTLV